MELKVDKIDKDTKEAILTMLGNKKKKLLSEGKLIEADEVDVYMFVLQETDNAKEE